MKKLLTFFSLLLTLQAFLAPPVKAEDKPFVVYPGDIVQVTVWKEDGLDRETLVLEDGTISFPLIGSIKVAGLTTDTIQNKIKDSLNQLIPDANVTVIIKAPNGHTASVLGQVTKPGEYVIARPLTVMEALSLAGGVTPFADEGNILVIRTIKGKKTTIPFPYDDVVNGKELDKDIELIPSDVIVVPTAGLI